MRGQPRVVVQCRLSSSRLPAKALLPIAGIPAVVLCCHRAANTGLQVLVATSTDQSDDALADILTHHGIPCLRGPLDDVRARYLQAASDLSEHEFIVRITADNVFPDGAFITELLQFATARQLEYCAPFFPDAGLPYGLTAEVFTAGVLRSVAEQNAEQEDCEHVTTTMRRRATPANVFRPSSWSIDATQLRCTLDTFEDYQRLLKVFRGVADPVRISWRELVYRLANLDDAPKFRIPWRRRESRVCGVMAIGTAQLGLERYGVANRVGRPERDVAIAMIRHAVNHGVTDLDCARAYGEAESRVGEALSTLPREYVRVCTKLDPLVGLDENSSAEEVAARVEASVLRSCRELRTPVLDVLMLHRWSHRTSHNGKIWATLKALQAAGYIRRLGASVYSPLEAITALDDPDISHLQLPFNVLDHRWLYASVPERVLRRPDVTVHARSVFLQGILVAGPEVWPPIPNVNPAAWIRRLEAAVRELNRLDRADLCFAYVASQRWIDAIVVGVENPAQLTENLERCRRPPLDPEECSRLQELFKDAPDQLLNPSEWIIPR